MELGKIAPLQKGHSAWPSPAFIAAVSTPGEALGFDQGALSGISVKTTRAEENQSFLMAEFGSFLVGPTSLVKEYLLAFAKFSEGQAKLPTKFLHS